jgi:hypothetical protein
MISAPVGLRCSGGPVSDPGTLRPVMHLYVEENADQVQAMGTGFRQLDLVGQAPA